MRFSEIVGFVDLVKEHRSHLRLELEYASRGSAEALVQAWENAGQLLARLPVDELREIAITNATEALRRAEQMRGPSSLTDAREHAALETLIECARERLAKAIVAACLPESDQPVDGAPLAKAPTHESPEPAPEPVF